jgi:hypothetical protein
MPPAKTKPKLAVKEGAKAGAPPSYRASKKGQTSARKQDSKRGETPAVQSKPIATIPENAEDVAGAPRSAAVLTERFTDEEKLWNAIAERDRAKERAEAAETALEEAKAMLAERTELAAKEAEGRAAAEARAANAEQGAGGKDNGAAEERVKALEAEIAALKAGGGSGGGGVGAETSVSSLEKQLAEALERAERAERRAAKSDTALKAVAAVARSSGAMSAAMVATEAMQANPPSATDPTATAAAVSLPNLSLPERMERDDRKNAGVVLQKVARGKLTRKNSQAKLQLPPMAPAGAGPAAPELSVLPVEKREGGGGMATPRAATAEQTRAVTAMQKIQRGKSQRNSLRARGVLRQEMGGSVATPRQGPAEEALPEISAEEAARLERQRTEAAIKIECFQRRKQAYKQVGAMKIPSIAIPGAAPAPSAAPEAPEAPAVPPTDAASADGEGRYRVNIEMGSGGDVEGLRVRVEMEDATPVAVAG